MGKLQYSIVAFLDVLGFSAMVKHDSEAEEEKFLPRIISIFEKLADTPKPAQMSIRMFSDSITITAPLSPENILRTIEVCAELQILCLKQKILLRGGISFGKHFSNESLIFSDALVKAYSIESKIARFPRIVIDPNTLNYAWHDQYTNDELKEGFRKLVVIDRDGANFVHYLNSLGEVRIPLQELLEEKIPQTETVMEKLRWLYDYHNHYALAEDKPLLRIETLVNGFSQLTEIP
ncbi:hypothetical protein os1_43860 [Comamonadaceae bacterium OS-1]|nr:hypothetical protein os1_43860 [Comamonadaceae bacterium OS-1]